MAAGSITWDLIMRTATFETDSKKAEKRLAELRKEAEALGKTLGIAVAGAATALSYAIKDSIDTMDDLSKSAQKVGTTTEALSALQYAAGLSDVATEELTASMAKLARQAADANPAFEAMGVSVKDAQGNLKDTSVILSEVADKFASYRDGAEKTALAQELFGKSGATLIPLLNSGAAGLRDMADEASALGLVIDTSTGKAAENFNDTLTRIQATFKGVINIATAEMLPMLQAIADYALDSSKNTGFLSAALGALKTVIQTVVVVGSDVVFVFKGIGGEIAAIAAQLTLLAKGDWQGAKFIGEKWTADAAQARKDLDAFQARIMGVAPAVESATEAVTKSGDKLAAPLVKAAESAKVARKAIETEAERARKALEREGLRLTQSVATPAEKRDSSIADANRLAGAGVISPETQKRAIADAEQTYADYVEKQRQLLTDGLLTEEQEITKSYERRRQMILALTEATEQEKAQAVASLTEKYELDQSAARLARYSDLLTEEQRLTADYTARRRQIEDDDTLSSTARSEYLLRLSENYHASMQKLDEEDQAKREALSKQQIALVETGFSGMADLAKAFAGEQSNTYKALFAVSKAFAIADITIKQSQAIAKAWGENNYWTAIGLTVGLAAQFAGLLSSTQSASFGGTRADGGSVNAGRSYLVGERGPERFVPDTGGTIIPNDALGSGQSSNPQIRIVNAFDDGHIDDYLGSNAAEKKIVNAVRRNRRALGMA